MRQIVPAIMVKNICGAISRQWLGMFLVCFISLGAISQAYGAGGDIIWQASDAQAGKQEAKASVIDSQGNVIVTGYQNLAGGTNDDYYTVKFKADGSGVAWRASFDKAGGSDQATAVVVDANDDVIVTGFAWNGLNKDIHTIKYSGATGAVIWQHTYDGTAHGNDIGTSIAVDSLNNIYVGGNSQNDAGNDDYLVLKYSPDGGAPIWQVAYNGAANGIDQATSIAAGMDGIAVTGQSWNGTAFDMTTVKYDFSGAELWEKRYTTGAGACVGKQIKMDTAGNVVVTGSAANSIDLDIYTAKYNGASGAVIWSKTYNGAYDDEPNGMVLDTTGDVYITGYTWTLAGTNDFYSARYNGGTGALVWQQIFDSGNGNTDVAIATGIGVDPSGDVFVTGYTLAAGNYNFQTIKYKKDNGNQLWQQSFNGAANGNDRPVGIWVTSAGDVLVTGWSDSGANGLDYYVIKYDPGTLNPPTNLAASSLSDTSIQLTWTDNSSNEDGFKIERKLGEFGTYSQIALVGPNTTTYTDPGLTANNYYYYRVRSYSAANGDSHYSNEAHALTVVVNFLPPAWSYLYNSPDNQDDFATAIAVGPDNNPVVTGYSLRTIGGFDYYTAKLNRADSSGIWSDLFDDPDSQMDVAKCVAVDSANNAIVSGYAQMFYAPAQGNINSIYTIKYPVAGPPESWHAQYNGPGAIDDRAVAIATTTDAANNVVVLGYGKNAANNDDIYVVKYNADGTKAWSITPFDGGGDDIPSAVAVAPDGSVYVTGYSEKAPNINIYNFFTAKYNGATGALIWSDIYSVVTGGDNHGNSLAVDGNGDLYVTGYATNGAGNKDIYTIKYSGASGTAQRLWERSFDGPAQGDDVAIGVKVDPIDGAIVVAGTTLTNPGDHDVTLIRYTQAGDLVWQKTLQRPANDDYATAMTVDSSGYIYIAGNTSNGTNVDMISLIYDFEGIFLGATTFNGAANGNDEASSIAVNYQGEAFIAGYSTNASGNADYMVVKQTNNYILVPAPFTVTPQADYSKVNLAWGNNTAGTSFRIERTLGPVSGGSLWTLIDTAAAGTTGYQDSGLNPDTSYCYRIEAFNGSLVSRKITACIITPIAPPVLRGLTAVSTNAIDVFWDNVSGNTGYKVERKTGAGGTYSQIGGILPADTTVYHDIGLSTGTTYYYRVSAVNGVSFSLTSNELSAATLLPAPVLNVPSGITSSSINLSWANVVGNTGYKLQRSLDNATWSQIATPAQNTTSYSDTGLASGTTYYYWLATTNASGVSASSTVQSAKTKLQMATMNSAAAASTSQINLVWTDPNGGASVNETGFTIEYAACANDDPALCTNVNDAYWGSWSSATIAADNTSMTVGSLTAGRTYRFRVTATLSGANSDPSNMITGTTTAFTPPVLSPLTVLSMSAIDVSWGNVTGNGGYKVERKTDAGGTYIQVGGNLAKDTVIYHDTGLSAGTVYYYRVSILNSVGTSNEQSVITTPAAPSLSAPTGVTTSQMTLSWGNVTGNAGYKLERSTDNVTWSQVATPASNVTSYSDSGLVSGKIYYYRIRATNASGDSLYSSAQSATTKLQTPSLTSATAASNTQVALAWTDPNGGSTGNETAVTVEYSLCSNTDPVSCSDVNGAYWEVWAPINLAADSTAYTVGSLSAGRTYRFRVTDKLTVADSAPSNMVAATTNLVAPTNLTASVASISSITLSWSDIAGETNYKVEQNDTILAGVTLTQNSTSYTVTGLSMNVPYCFRVQPYNSASSAFSNQVCATIYGPPTLSSVTSSSATQVDIGWTDVSGETGYEVWQSAASNQSSPPVNPGTGSWGAYVNLTPSLLAADSSLYHATGLTAGYTYKYKVRYKLPDNSFSAFSAEMQATTVPPVPSGLTSSVVSTSAITVSWTDGPGETGYNSQYKAMSGVNCASEDWSGVPSNGVAANSTSYPVIGLTAGVTYCFRANASNAAGTSAWSAAISQTTSLPAPTLNPLSGIGQMNMDLTWGDVTGNNGYTIERSTNNITWSQIATPVAGQTTYSDTTVVPNTTYYYRVSTKNSAGLNSAVSNVQSGTTQAIPVPTLNPLSGIGQMNMDLTWGDVTGNNGYKIERSTDNITWSQIAMPVAGQTTYSDTTVVPNTTYYYRVSTKNIAGLYSAVSNVQTGTTQAIPTPVLVLSGVIQTKIDLSWGNVSGNTGYKIERSLNNSTWLQLNLPVANSTSYSDMNLIPNQIYYYRMYTKNSGGYWSVASSVQSAITIAVSAPTLAAPSGITTSQIMLNWNDVAGNIGYKVERSTDGTNWTLIATPAQGVVSYTNTGLSSATTYYYRLSTKIVNTSSYTSPSAVQSVTTTLVAPMLSLNGISESRIDLTWQVVFGATNYKVMRSIGTGGPWSQVNNLSIAYTTLYCGYYPTPTIGCPTLVPAYTSYADVSLADNTQYCYQLTAWNVAVGDSAPSNMICLKTSAVGGLILTAVTPLNSSKIKLDWTYNPAACTPNPCDTPDGFEVWRQILNGEWALVTTLPNMSTYTDTTAIEPLKNYTYRVRAYKGSDESAYSNMIGVFTPAFSTADGTCP